MRYGNLAKVEYIRWLDGSECSGRVPSYPTFARRPYFIEDEGNSFSSENFPLKSGEVEFFYHIVPINFQALKPRAQKYNKKMEDQGIERNSHDRNQLTKQNSIQYVIDREAHRYIVVVLAFNALKKWAGLTSNQQLSSGTITRIYRNTKYASLAAIGSSIRDIDIFSMQLLLIFFIISHLLAQDSYYSCFDSILVAVRTTQMPNLQVRYVGVLYLVFLSYLRHILRHFCNVLGQNNGNLKQSIAKMSQDTFQDEKTRYKIGPYVQQDSSCLKFVFFVLFCLQLIQNIFYPIDKCSRTKGKTEFVYSNVQH